MGQLKFTYDMGRGGGLKDLMIYKCYGLEIWYDCSWRQMRTSYQKWRHHLIWSWNYTPKREIFKNADQAFLAEVFSLFLQKSIFWLIFNIISKLEPKKFKVLTIFYFALLWPTKRRIIIITFINFETLKAICVWTTTQIDLKFWGYLQGIRIYSQIYGFLIIMF